MSKKGIINMINGPVIRAKNMSDFKMREMVMVGEKKLIGEVIILDGDIGTIQVYEETEGLKIGEEIISTGKPLSVKLGPGMLGNMFDGIQRPLLEIAKMNKDFIPEGIGMISIDEEKLWEVSLTVKSGDQLNQGDIFGFVQETSLIQHKLLVPPGKSGIVKSVVPNGKYTIEQTLVVLENQKEEYELKMYHEWPVRDPRPVKERKEIQKPLITGQRVLDLFFPLAKGGTCAIPGGFGTGKTMTQHQLAKWSDADIIIYIGCGERGNEMTEVLEDFPKLIDPKSGKPLMERTILIANTSNMPVAAREASIYTGITMAEYFRDMGYDVAIMADSTSRWAEALREISGRLEEMPAEEGYPAYLPSRIAEFYERAGYVEALNEQNGSVTIIGAVSPAGGDFSEPVTENTKRFVNVFLALDKELAYARHYPAINWLNSYSGYTSILENWYEENLAEDAINLRNKMLELLYNENKLQEIVMLVGEDVLPDDQRLVLEIAKLIKIGFLQQNAFHELDTYVPLEKQYQMLKIIDYLYEKCKKVLKLNVPISQIKNSEIFGEILKMKYTVPNEDFSKINEIEEMIDRYYDNLEKKYLE
ncbi:V-type ATP synthase subunit A [Garciella nitratireducens]|uniref:V-type ATP synthase alpha chain n=1 Tax=Garciella nitratireducens DSM 15102 TaxID=1121911 RepID=A0A1T4KFU3_9FIRM|nr:V-type ATP synthase subunit A [Garciella nitratireducens]RBP42775.1 V/A-type H+-transporting ATPase subunit A [Garciella nitratireducens]SJZ41213.1 V/A-type H+-transporting ATPase subunit A [Garciella nitratireducens DSM 15102]